MNKNYYMYVLLCADNTLYCGFTDNVEKRLATHQAGKGAKYTRPYFRNPLKLIYYEKFNNKSAALKAEYQFKHQTKKQKLIYLREHGVNLY